VLAPLTLGFKKDGVTPNQRKTKAYVEGTVVGATDHNEYNVRFDGFVRILKMKSNSLHNIGDHNRFLAPPLVPVAAVATVTPAAPTGASLTHYFPKIPSVVGL
jgi:hypothetical protein